MYFAVHCPIVIPEWQVLLICFFFFFFFHLPGWDIAGGGEKVNHLATPMHLLAPRHITQSTHTHTKHTNTTYLSYASIFLLFSGVISSTLEFVKEYPAVVKVVIYYVKIDSRVIYSVSFFCIGAKETVCFFPPHQRKCLISFRDV